MDISWPDGGLILIQREQRRYCLFGDVTDRTQQATTSIRKKRRFKMNKKNSIKLRIFLAFFGSGTLIGSYYNVVQSETVWGFVFSIIYVISGFTLALMAVAPNLDKMIIGD